MPKQKKDETAERLGEELVQAMNKLGTSLTETTRAGNLGQMLRNLGDNAVADEYQNLETIAEREMHQMYNGLMRGTLTPSVIYEDPDQTKITEKDAAQILRNKWANGMDYAPHNPFFRHYSDWMLDIYLGNYDKFMRHVNKLTANELERQLKKRETFLHVGAIFHAIIGARSIFPGSPIKNQTARVHGGPEMKYVLILEKLLELGADWNVHDVAGYTPLHHCLTSQGNATTLKMAKILLNKGADPNAQNRFGSTPLNECVMCNLEEAVQLLVKHGAKPWIKDVDGICALDLSRVFPAMTQILKKADKKEIKKEREAAKETTTLKRCAKCNLASNKRCTGCFLEWYCSQECQRSHWDDHKADCKSRREEFEEVNFIKDGYGSTINMQSGKVYSRKMSRPVKSKASPCFVVKVQVAKKDLFGNQVTDKPIMVYNKDRSVQGLIPHDDELGSKLDEIIRKRGFQGEKGYFPAMKIDNTILINPSILPPETW